MKDAETDAAQKYFKDTLDKLSIIGGFSMHVSEALTGESTTEAGMYASMVHAKMCAHATSIGALSKSSTFDHSAIMTLSRMIMEAMTMYFYLREDVEEEEWMLRYLILRLHDTVARIKLMRAIQSREEQTELRNGRQELVKELEANAIFKSLNAEQQVSLKRGEAIFLGGMRSAASRAARWRAETFMALYSYFSAHAHSAPQSYMRWREHSIDFRKPSAGQLVSAALALDVSGACLRRVSIDHLRTSHSASQQFPRKFLASLEKEDIECEIFTYGVS